MPAARRAAESWPFHRWRRIGALGVMLAAVLAELAGIEVGRHLRADRQVALQLIAHRNEEGEQAEQADAEPADRLLREDGQANQADAGDRFHDQALVIPRRAHRSSQS